MPLTSDHIRGLSHALFFGVFLPDKFPCPLLFFFRQCLRTSAYQMTKLERFHACTADHMQQPIRAKAKVVQAIGLGQCLRIWQTAEL